MAKEIPFYKYQGTGNDFIIVDQLKESYLGESDMEIIKHMCHRRFGIGADGLILLQTSESYDFEMIYFNADGLVGSLCGNGARCAVACGHELGLFEHSCQFDAADGMHEASRKSNGIIELKMKPVEAVELGRGYFILDTGSPHYVTFVEDLSDLDISQSGRVIRYSDRFRDVGINVNFVQELKDSIEVSTYERGVENETLSCGTGVTAAALAHAVKHNLQKGQIKVKTKGGELKLKYKKGTKGFRDIWLSGAAEPVYQGKIRI